jgi:hypothetical protein
LKDDNVKSEQHTPSAKPKYNIARISNFLVKSAIIYETFRLERLRIGIDFLVMSHAPVNAI